MIAEPRPPRPRSAVLPDGLTQHQSEILLLIVRHLTSEGRPPTFRWLMEQTGVRAINGMTSHLTALVRKGWITRDHTRSAGIRLRGCALRLECDGSPAGRRLARLLGRDSRSPEEFAEGGGI